MMRSWRKNITWAFLNHIKNKINFSKITRSLENIVTIYNSITIIFCLCWWKKTKVDKHHRNYLRHYLQTKNLKIFGLLRSFFFYFNYNWKKKSIKFETSLTISQIICLKTIVMRIIFIENKVLFVIIILCFFCFDYTNNHKIKCARNKYSW